MRGNKLVEQDQSFRRKGNSRSRLLVCLIEVCRVLIAARQGKSTNVHEDCCQKWDVISSNQRIGVESHRLEIVRKLADYFSFSVVS
jgi:hypothetical protein